jgi:hypothetical protein
MMVPGGKPVMAVPGAAPSCPTTLVPPVLDIPVPDRTPKAAAVPIGGALAANALERPGRIASEANSRIPRYLFIRLFMSGLILDREVRLPSCPIKQYPSHLVLPAAWVARAPVSRGMRSI